MDILDYIKLIISANLDIINLLKLKIPQNQAEIIFKYRYGHMYCKIKDIIKINKELNFDDHTEESPYLWKILLKDQVLIETNPSIGFMACSYCIDYLSHEYVTFNCMIKFYREYPNLYIYLNKLLEYRCGIYLFYDAVISADLNRVANIKDILTNIGGIVNINTFFNGPIFDNRLVIPIIIFIHFLKIYKSPDQLIYNKIDITANVDRQAYDESRYFYDDSFYQRYEGILSKYLVRI